MRFEDTLCSIMVMKYKSMPFPLSGTRAQSCGLRVGVDLHASGQDYLPAVRRALYVGPNRYGITHDEWMIALSLRSQFTVDDM